jgi:hypothetical protein
MPASAPASPAVVIVRTPSMNESFSFGKSIGFQRIGAIGTSISWQGAVRHRPMAALLNSPQCATVGRMR